MIMSFNGAGVRKPRIPGSVAAERSRADASMEPGSENPGYLGEYTEASSGL